MASRNKLPGLRNQMSLGGRRQYAQEFIEVVVARALRHDLEEASAYYDVPVRTIEKWCKRFKDVSKEATAIHVATDNPYRLSDYGISRRIRLSDKLFAELEHTVELTKIKHGYVPADVLHKLVTAYGMLVDKRRLEEGAHTALVQAVRDPEEVYQEGEAKVVQFRQRHSLPAGS